MLEAIFRMVALRVLLLFAFVPVAVFWFGAKALGLSEWLGLVALIVVITVAFIWRRGCDLTPSVGGMPDSRILAIGDRPSRRPRVY